MVAELVALVIFVIMFLLIVLDRIPRQWVTLGCGALMLVLVFGVCMHDGGAIWDTLNLSAFGQSTFWYGASESSGGINWSTIVFIAGMMVMVEGMGHVGIFRWLCLKLAKAVHYRTVPLLVCFMVMAAVLSMFIDSITVILFLAAVTAELGRTLRFDPVPMILAEIFCANLGGSATMCGDPPNIIIGTSLGLTFFDFLTNTGVIVLICLVATVVYFYFCFRKQVQSWDPQARQKVMELDPRDSIHNRGQFAIHVVLFLVVVVLLITHAQTGLTVATVGIIAAILTLLVNRQTPANPDTHYTGTNGVSVYYDSSIWKVCQMTEDAALGTVLELATADSADGAEDYQAVLLQRGTADTYPDFIDDSEKDLKQAYGIIKPRTANITVEGAEVTAVRCDIQTYYAVLATITYDSGDVVYVSALTKLASINDIVNLVESVSLS